MDAILGRGVGARGCIAVELRSPERRHGMAESEFSGGGGGVMKGTWVDPTNGMLMRGKRNDSIEMGMSAWACSQTSLRTSTTETKVSKPAQDLVWRIIVSVYRLGHISTQRSICSLIWIFYRSECLLFFGSFPL